MTVDNPLKLLPHARHITCFYFMSHPVDIKYGRMKKDFILQLRINKVIWYVKENLVSGLIWQFLEHSLQTLHSVIIAFVSKHINFLKCSSTQMLLFPTAACTDDIPT